MIIGKTRKLRRKVNEAGYSTDLVACGWAGAVEQKFNLRETAAETFRRSDRKTNQLTDREIDRQTDRQTDRRINMQKQMGERIIHTQTHEDERPTEKDSRHIESIIPTILTWCLQSDVRLRKIVRFS